MMTNLSWSALIFAILAALACWNPEDRSGCDGSRPVFGTRACCERHKTACKITLDRVSDLESARRADVTPPIRP
jgi:hypothetical protein